MACVWLIGSWLLSIGVKPPIEPSSASYTPGVRLMLVCIGIGLMIGWPMLRLSQSVAARPIVQTVLDLTVLVSLIQVVIWPLRLVTPWTVARTAALDATLVGWTVLSGAVIASALGSHRRGVRNLAITACLAICLLGPVLAVIGAITPPVAGWAGPLMNIGPLVGVYRLAQGGPAPVTGTQWVMIVMPAAAAGLAWTALGVVCSARRASPQPAEPRTNVD